MKQSRCHRRVISSFEQLESRKMLAADLPAIADAYVRDGASAGLNFGADTTLIAKRSANLGNTREFFIRFNIAGTSIASGQSVKLRLFGKLADTQNTNLPVAVYPVANTTWSESAITWNTRPAAGATSLGSKTINGTTGTWYEWDVTNYVLNEKANGRTGVAFVLRSTNRSDTQIVFNSEEGASNDPVLRVSDPVVTPPPSGTTTTIPISIASYVRGGSYASTNFGTATELLVKRSATSSNIRETYLQIDLSTVSKITTGKLRLYGGLSAAGSVQVNVYSTGTNWTEGGITYNNRPAAAATVIASKTITSSTKSWHEFDITNFLKSEKAAGRNLVSLVIKAPNITDPWVTFNADGASTNRPQAVITAAATSSDPLAAQLDSAAAFAEQQLRNTVQGLPNDSYPQYTLADGSWKLETVSHWTAGLLPGALWKLYERTGDTFYRDQATARTLPIAGQTSKVDDLTFRILNSFRPLYENTGNASYRQVILDAAASKNTQWNETVGAFRTPWRKSTSGDSRANFGVLMDQSMDMELMFWAAKQTGNQQYYDRAVRHLQTVAANLIRSDGGSFHWAYFYDQTGEFISGETYQGYADTSTWARGQAWGIYSFTMAYRETGRAEFLAAARKMADYFLAHLPADHVPFWDFNDPAAPNTYRDSSAAAIAASGLIELSTLLRADGSVAAADGYLADAKDILSSLSSSAYLARGTASRGVLLHGALNVPTNTGTDSSLIFGDYYFLEAINRYAALP